MIPTIPSDNLYKAIAYLGGILITLGFLVPSWERDRFAREQVVFLKDINALNVQIILAKPAQDEKNEAVKAKRQELERLVEQNHDSHKAWLADELHRFEARCTLSKWAVEIGGILVVLGGVIWWFKVQRLIDQQLANDARPK
jgi:hypothetical protein